MKSIQELITDLNSLPEKNQNSHLNYYRNNQLSILNLNPKESNSHYLTKTKTLSIYGDLLIENGNYHDAYEILKKAKETFEINPFNSVDLENDLNYTKLKFNFGRASYLTGKKEQAKTIFQILIDKDPNNDLYKNWINGLKTEKLVAYDKYVFYIFLIWLIADVFFGNNLPKPYSTINFYIGGTLLITSIVFHFHKRYQSRKLKENSR